MSVVERVHTWAHLMHMREADPSIEGQCFLGTHIFSRLAEVDHTQAAGGHDVHDSKHAVLLVALEADCMLPAAHSFVPSHVHTLVRLCPAAPSLVELESLALFRVLFPVLYPFPTSPAPAASPPLFLVALSPHSHMLHAFPQIQGGHILPLVFAVLAPAIRFLPSSRTSPLDVSVEDFRALSAVHD